MFSRTSSIAHICLRCQKRLVQHRPSQLPSKWASRTGVVRRQQSTATAVAEEEDDDDIDIKAEDILSYTPEDNGDSYARQFYGTKFWRPSPTANLGMDALGKPAEVLILPSRDRRIPIVPTEPDEKPREGLYESLESEKEPLSWEQLKENIEHARVELGLQRGELDKVQARNLRRNLEQRFRSSQLRKYVAMMQDVLPEDRRLLIRGRKKSSHYISFITEELWGYIIPKPQKPSFRLQNRVTATIGDNKGDFDVLFRDVSGQYLNIQKMLNVEIATDPENHKVTIVGEVDSVRKAQKQIDSLIKSIKVAVFEMQSLPHHLFHLGQPELARSLLEGLAMKHGVVMFVDKDQQLVIKHLNLASDQIKNLRRDLCLSLNPDTKLQTIGSWPNLAAKATFVAPFQPSAQLSWFQAQSSWGRRIQTGFYRTHEISHNYLTAREKEMYENTAGSIAEFFSEKLMPWPQRSPNSPRYEFSASFGQVLHDRAQSSDTNTEISNTKRSNPIFVGDVPLLAQFLAARTVLPVFDQNNHPRTEKHPQVIARLLLAPSVQSVSAPTFEIFLLGEERDAGLSQPLRIARVSAIYEEKSYKLLIPSGATDIEFTRQLKQDLYSPPANHSATHPEILRQLAGYLNSAKKKKSNEVDFKPFSTFKLPTTFLQSTQKQSETDSQPTDPPKSKPKIDTSKQTIEYMLISAESLDIACYQPALVSKFVLQDTIFNGGPWGPDRREFRLAELPLLYPPWPKKTKFDKFFHAAMEVAAGLGREAGKVSGGVVVGREDTKS